MHRLRSRIGFSMVLLSVALVFLAAPAAAAEPGPNARAIERVMQVQDRNTPWLMALPDVVGTATGLNAAGNPVVKVFTTQALVPGIPAKLEGEPVVVQVTGTFFALPKPDKPGKPPGKGKEKVDPTSRFDRPVPIGVSTGNWLECSAGTIGCRVTDGTNVYALSNNHVYALENIAPLGSKVLQPGLYDTGCVYDETNVIGTLDRFAWIHFDGSENTVDAAVAISTTEDLGRATPSNGYGTPKPTTMDAYLAQRVQKYGRTTSLTKGEVTGISAIVEVTYSSGKALFVGQIIVEARKPLIKPGDSGSLLVTRPDAYPVGLLFAGNATGKMAVANPINSVLDALNVSIDGE